jgi:hypothetical protein
VLSASDQQLLGGAAKRKSIGTAGGRKKGDGNICQAPYFVKEGDQFCVFAFRKGEDVLKEIAIARPDDILLRQAKDQEREMKEERRRAGRGFFGDGKSKAEGGEKVIPREVMLSIGRNYSFSDDEEEVVEP